MRAWVQRIINGTERVLKFKGGLDSKDQVKYFIKRQLGGMTKIRPLAFNHAKWFTSRNISKCYETFKDPCLELGFDVPIPLSEYDPLESLSKEIEVIQPE